MDGWFGKCGWPERKQSWSLRDPIGGYDQKYQTDCHDGRSNRQLS